MEKNVIMNQWLVFYAKSLWNRNLIKKFFYQNFIIHRVKSVLCILDNLIDIIDVLSMTIALDSCIPFWDIIHTVTSSTFDITYNILQGKCRFESDPLN